MLYIVITSCLVSVDLFIQNTKNEQLCEWKTVHELFILIKCYLFQEREK